MHVLQPVQLVDLRGRHSEHSGEYMGGCLIAIRERGSMCCGPSSWLTCTTAFFLPILPSGIKSQNRGLEAQKEHWKGLWPTVTPKRSMSFTVMST